MGNLMMQTSRDYNWKKSKKDVEVHHTTYLNTDIPGRRHTWTMVW